MKLDPRLDRLLQEKGFREFTEPQRKALEPILQGEDTLIIAPTGSGKTEAALIPIFNIMLRDPGDPIQAIYITPLKSLNRDIVDRMIWWATKLDFTVAVRHSDTTGRERRRQSLNPPHILITTPETFTYLLNTRNFSRYMDNTRWVVIDELHELIPSKRGVQLSIALERLRRRVEKIQVIGLSATIGNPGEALKYITGDKVGGSIVRADVEKKYEINIEYPSPEEVDTSIAERLYTYPEVAARVRHIVERITRHGKTLVFTNTRPMAEILGNRILLYTGEAKIAVHHSSIGADYRIRVENLYKRGVLEAIVSTSSLELGIDIGDIRYVIQYGSPRQVSKLIQRIGRSGHWIEEVSKGEVVTLDPLDTLEAIAIRRFSRNNRVEKLQILDKPLDVLTHELAGMLIAHKKIKISEIKDVLSSSTYYKTLSEEELRSLIEYVGTTVKIWRLDGDHLRPLDFRKLYRYYFNNLSMIPDIKQYPVIDDTTGRVVGVLDDEFLAVSGEEGVKIILAGRPWRIIQIFNEKVFVKPEEDIIGAVPDWIGEEIPVPYEVAREIGRILRRFKELTLGKGFMEAIDTLSRELRVPKNVILQALEPFKIELDKGHEIPTDRDIVIETHNSRIIVNVFGGTNGNRSLESYLVNRLKSTYGIDPRHTSDQYRIILENPLLEIEHVLEILKNPVEVLRHIREEIPSTGIFRWRFLNVAKRMGLISKDADITSSVLNTMIEHSRGTPPYIEAYRETLKKDHDIEAAEQILQDISTGEFILHIYRDYISRYTSESMKYSDIPMEGPRESRYQMLEILATKAKILSTYLSYACLRCGEYFGEARLLDIPEPHNCRICGSDEIGYTTSDVDKVVETLYKLLRGDKRGAILRELRRTSRLWKKYGKAGVYAYLIGGLTNGDIEKALSIEPKIGDRLTKILLEMRRMRLLQRIGSSR